MTTAKPNPKQNKNKVKLIKDLKYGQTHLRQSLLDMDQIQDLDRIYKNKRQDYLIVDREDIVLEHNKIDENDQQIPNFLTPIQRLALYRKQKINKKIKDKMTKMWQQKPKNVGKLRKPKTEKMLQNFLQRYKKQLPISYVQHLKESQMNLSRIKKNQKFKFQNNNQNQKPLYISRMHLNSKKTKQNQEQHEQNLQTFITQEDSCRKRFLSLKTSKTQKWKQNYQPVRDIVQGKNRDNQNKKIIDIQHLEKQLQKKYNQITLKKKDTTQTLKQQNNYLENRNKSQMSVQRSKSQTPYYISNKNNKKKNPYDSIHNSEKSSAKIIQTMSSFYQSKHYKKNCYEQMVQNVKYDRPFTSAIRRKTYSLLGKQSLSPIQQYRSMSELQRKNYQNSNIQFYNQLLEGLESYHQEDIPTTIFIIEQIKRIMQSQYKITYEILCQLIGIIQKMQLDQKSQEILGKLGQYTGYDIILEFSK